MQIMEEVAIKPCPFCGGVLTPRTSAGGQSDIIVNYFHPGVVTDEDCLLSGTGVRVRDLAKWNTRAAQADRNPEGHDPAEGHGRNDESPVAAGDAPDPPHHRSPT